MNKETIVNSLRHVDFDEAQSLQLVNAMEDIGEYKISPAIAEMKLISERFESEMKLISERFESQIHQEINNQTWRFIGLFLAFVGAIAALLKFIH